MRRLTCVWLAGALLLSACATLPPQVSVDEALKLSREGVSADAIIAMMRESRSSYQLTASDIVRLSKQGLPDPVLDYMQQTQLDEVRKQERMNDWASRPPVFWHAWIRWR
ncbi:hypothetical protein QWZ03_11550 [Chitinimonas viridis]|uniref:Lipoprotein n=1 Tax=Chitinimonas viridis TaxID=664880 RepID=A0ABT8B5I0_9NEIS|nr:hypothetical protein [Chitinimonas viridis]MDN3577401.1 hypothetical protein [Chitinimonas viridis]